MTNIPTFDDNKWFKRCLVRYLHPVDLNSWKVTKADKLFGDELDFEDIQFPVKVKKIHKIKKENSLCISIFGYENKVRYPIYVPKKCFEEKIVDLILTGEENKKHYVLIKDLIHLCVTRHYIVEENIFVVSVYKI